MKIRAKQIFGLTLGLAFFINGCTNVATPPQGFYYPTISLCLGMSAVAEHPAVNPTPNPTPTPNPSPVPPDQVECPRCKGTGKVKFLNRQVTCRKCNGTGYIKKEDSKQQAEHTVMERNWLAPEDFVHDMEAYYQARQLAKDGNQCLLIDFAPDWCFNCVKWNKEHFDKPDVIEGLEKDFVLFRVKDGDLYKAFHLDTAKEPVPRMIVVAPNGNYRSFNPDPEYFNTRLNNALDSLGVK